MKKLFILLTIMIFCILNVSSQGNDIKYIELFASVDATGNIKMMPLVEKNKDLSDTVINYKQINAIIKKSKNAIHTINLLAKERWLLVSAISVNKDENGRPNTPFLAYYFKNE